jgi:hypothetical protein
VSKTKRRKNEAKKDKKEIAAANVAETIPTNALVANVDEQPKLLLVESVVTQELCDKVDTKNDPNTEAHYLNKKEMILKPHEKNSTGTDRDDRTRKKKPLYNPDKPVKKEKAIESKKKVEHDIRKAPELGLQTENKVDIVKVGDERSDSSHKVAVKIKLCHNCSTHHVQDHCPLTYPNFIIADSIDLTNWQDKYQNLHTSQSERIKCEKENDQRNDDINKFVFAKVSLPNFLQLLDTNTDHGLGVWAKMDIQEFTQFGPLVGKVVKEVDIPEDSNMRDLWEMCGENGNIYFNTENLEISNWMRFVRPALTRDDKNVTVVTKENYLYFVTTKLIKNGEELLYWQDSAVATNKKKMEKTCKQRIKTCIF